MLNEDLADRRAPLAILAALCLQAGGLVWWVSARDADLRFLQSRIEHVEQFTADNRAVQNEALQRLARIEERLAGESAQLDRIEKQVGRR